MTKKIIALVLVIATLLAMSSIAFTANAAKVSSSSQSSQGYGGQAHKYTPGYYRVVVSTKINGKNLPKNSYVYAWYWSGYDAYCQYGSIYGFVSNSYITPLKWWAYSTGRQLAIK